jgi:hypothetical protein
MAKLADYYAVTRWAKQNARVLKAAGSSPKRFISIFAEMAARDPSVTAAAFLGPARPRIHRFAESRAELVTRVQAGAPRLSKSFLDSLSDAHLLELADAVTAATGSTAAASPMAPPAPGPALSFAEDLGGEGDGEELSREDLILTLVEMGQDAAELEAMEDDELRALLEELEAEGVDLDQPAEQFAEATGMKPADRARFVSNFREVRRRHGQREALRILPSYMRR